MRNLKKRILSFVSAAAMVATLLPTTALFASAATETETITVSGLPFQNDNSVWDSTEITVTIPTADTYTAQVNYAGNSSGYFKVEIDDDATWGEGNWLSSNDWSGSAYKTASVSLTAGSHTIRFGGNNYVKFVSMTFSHEVEAYSDDLTSTATVIPNNANYGSVSVSTLTKGGDTTVATAANGYMFVGWLIMEDDGSNKKSLSTKKTLKVTEDIAGVINTYSNPDIVAQFGKKTRVRYEAEDFVNFISETKYDGKSNKTDEKYFHVHYDDPTVVADNNNTSKVQNWNHSSYSDLQIAPEYSAGGAVALTGPSNGLAIPFSLADDLDEDVEVELGYNYGTLSEGYENGSSNWWTGGLFVNLYYVSKSGDASSDWNKVKSALDTQGIWSVSGNATPDNASDLLKSRGTLSGNAFYYKLPVKSTNATILNSNGEIDHTVSDGTNTYEGALTGRDADQATTITLPAGLPAGEYYLSIATDENNYTKWDAYKYWGSGGNDGEGTVNYVYGGTDDNDDHVGTAYYDYIQFYTASTPDMPSPVQVGANFIFKDQWGNDLSSNAFSNSSFSGGKIMFSPEASRYLIVQGWNFKGWDIYEGTVSFDSNGTISGTKTGTISANGNSDIDTACAQLDALQYESGSTYTFVAKYEVQRKTTPVTATNGKIYVKQDSSDTTYTHSDAYGNIAQRFQTFSQLRLVANDDTDTQKFSYWTLNGMIYSYDREIYFMTWDAPADFVAVFETTAASATPTAFINTSHISTSGFDKEANKYHKIEFDCAYYVPSGCTYVSSGIIYTDNTGNIDSVNANNTTISSTGAITVNVSKIIVAANKKYLLFTEDDNGNKYNNQIMVSITNMGFEKTRKARAYLVYKDSNNELHVVYSSGTAQVTTPAWNG